VSAPCSLPKRKGKIPGKRKELHEATEEGSRSCAGQGKRRRKKAWCCCSTRRKRRDEFSTRFIQPEITRGASLWCLSSAYPPRERGIFDTHGWGGEKKREGYLAVLEGLSYVDELGILFGARDDGERARDLPVFVAVRWEGVT